MSSSAKWRNAIDTGLGLGVANGRVGVEAPVSRDKIKLLKLLVVELHDELEALGDASTPEIEQGVDFYDEVSRFEIEMIRWALTLVGGHQRKAARLLNLSATTLGTKIKHYRIQLGRPTIVSPPSAPPPPRYGI